jgi:alpha-D-xyloside xylohydrolase
VWRRERHDFFSLPLWVREGTVLPTGSRTDRPDYDYLDGLTVTVYPGGDGSTDLRVTDPTTGTAATFAVSRESGAVTVSASGTDARFGARMAGGPTVGSADRRAVIPRENRP